MPLGDVVVGCTPVCTGATLFVGCVTVFGVTGATGFNVHAFIPIPCPHVVISCHGVTEVVAGVRAAIFASRLAC